MLELCPFDAETATRAEWDAIHTFRRRRAEEDSPGDPIQCNADFEVFVCRRTPLYEHRRIFAWDGDSIIGDIGVSLRRPGTPDYSQHATHASLWGGVLAPHRLKGVATRLIAAILPQVVSAGGETLTFGSHVPAAHAMFVALGATLKYRSIENRLAFADIDWPMLEGWQAACPADLVWEIHTGRVAMERLQALIDPLTDLAQDVPLGELDLPPDRYHMANYETWYRWRHYRAKRPSSMRAR